MDLPELPPLETCYDNCANDWEKLLTMFQKEELPKLPKYEVDLYPRVLAILEHLFNPKSPRDLGNDQIKVLQRYMLNQLEMTKNNFNRKIVSPLRRLLKFALANGMIDEMPKISYYSANQKMAGRPVRRDEYLRMIAHVQERYGRRSHSKSWLFILRALWHSGLRRGELAKLTWDSSNFCVDLTGKRPMFRILEGGDKSGKAKLLPMAPKFAKLLATVPKEDRYGRVVKRHVLNIWVVVRRIARETGCFFEKPDGTQTPLKPHDFRRSFCMRWAKRLSPDKLMMLMRHKKYEVTLSHYIDNKSIDVADEMWRKAARNKRKPPVVVYRTVQEFPEEQSLPIPAFVAYVPPGIF